ncbi:TIGR00282 family metallophosphoesterase [candidate division KSB1 bacterium]
MTVLFIADIVGEPGINITRDSLKDMIHEHSIDFCIANGENASSGKGITKKTAEQLFEYGIDVITSGNHYWDREGVLHQLSLNKRILRPANYPGENTGEGSGIYPLVFNHKIAVLNLQGRTFMQTIDCPFKKAVSEIELLRNTTKLIVVDIHAEATAEKKALAYYLDGKVSAVIGTHTHIQTADEMILPGGTAYITDAGMTGPVDSVIGIDKEIAIKRFIYQTPFRYKIANGLSQFNGILLNIDQNSGKAQEIRRIAFTEM